MEELTLFNYDRQPFKIDKPIRLIELFAGIGSQAKALKRIGADFEHYRVCEFDKYAVASYNAIHGTDFATSDITQITADDLGIVDTDKYCYLMTYSFPCQDLSLAGKQKLMAKGSGTRSSLLWEVERLLNECDELPQVLLMENVTQVHGKKNIEHFNEWIDFLESKGYSNYWKDLNAKNFGVPQNRNRTFMVSILGRYTYEFPQEFPLQLRLKHLLEDSVEEKYYISNKGIEYITKRDGKYTQICDENTEIAKGAITAVGNQNWTGNFIRKPKGGGQQEPKVIEPRVIGGIGEKKSNGGTQWYQQDRIYDNEVAMSVTTGFLPYYKTEEPAIDVIGNYSPSGRDASRIVNADGLAPTVKENHGTVTAIAEPFIVASRGRNPDNPSDRTPGAPTEQRLEPNFSGCANTLTTVQKDNYVAEPLAYDEQNGYIRKDGTVGTLTTDGSSPKHNNRVVEPMVWDGYNQRIRAEKGTVGTLTTNCGADLKRNAQGIVEGCRIRKLTPKECYLLMGFDPEDFEKAAQCNSNSQLYKQAGNSIVVDVLYYIFKQML